MPVKRERAEERGGGEHTDEIACKRDFVVGDLQRMIARLV